MKSSMPQRMPRAMRLQDDATIAARAGRPSDRYGKAGALKYFFNITSCVRIRQEPALVRQGSIERLHTSEMLCSDGRIRSDIRFPPASSGECGLNNTEQQHMRAQRSLLATHILKLVSYAYGCHLVLRVCLTDHLPQWRCLRTCRPSPASAE